MSAQRDHRPDRGTMNGVSRAMKQAFAPDSPVDPGLRELIQQVDGTYGPDQAADHRAKQLLERLKKLPWDGVRA